MKLLNYIILIFALFSCDKKHDIYQIVSKKSPLTKDILLKSTSIINHNDDLILRLKNIEQISKYSSYILFYDRKLKLKGFCDLQSIGLESISGDTIHGYINEYNKSSQNIDLSELPKNYQLDIKKLKIRSGIRIRNKIIDSIQVNFKNKEVELYIKKATENLFAGFKDIKNPNFSDNFTESIRLKYKISDLFFDYDRKIISIGRRNNSSSETDEMLILNNTILDKFYNDLWVAMNTPTVASLGTD